MSGVLQMTNVGMRRVACLAVLATVVLASCSRKRAVVAGPVMVPTTSGPSGAAGVDAADLYRRLGFFVSTGEVPFVGSVRFLAGPGDSTFALVALSMANRALTFTRENERYRAAYTVTLQFRRGGAVLHTITTREEVRVPSARETTRSDESIIFQHALEVPPGAVDLDVTVSDEGSTHRGRAQSSLLAPAFETGALGWPIVAYAVNARSARAARPEVVMNPRSTATYARDSVVEVYLEAYGRTLNFTLMLEVRTVEERSLFTDTVPLVDRGGVMTGTARLPVARMGFGLLHLVASRHDGDNPVRVPLIIGFGDGLVASTFDEMVQYLRHFTSAERLRALREAPPGQRASEWAAFVRATDANPATAENEALREYLARLENANARYREGATPGWSTHRGMVYGALGEPDNVSGTSEGTVSRTPRTQVWEYLRHRMSFTFVDQAGLDRWRLTPASEADFQTLFRRLKP